MRRNRKRQQDRQRTEAVGICARCGGELYPGSPYWRLNGGTLCEPCLLARLVEELAPYRNISGEVRG